MTPHDWTQVLLYFGVLAALAKPLRTYMARVYEGQSCVLDGALGWLERGLYRAAEIDFRHEMSWRRYVVAVLLFNAIGFLPLYALLRLQHLLPLTLVMAAVLVSQGVIQNFRPYQTATVMQPTVSADGATIDTQMLAMGPAASQIAIKQLSTNGGGFFNGNSAHRYENPTPLSNVVELLSILLIPAALCYTFGVMVRDTRQGWALLAAMFAIFIPLVVLAVWQEQSGVPAYSTMGIDQAASSHADHRARRRLPIARPRLTGGLGLALRMAEKPRFCRTSPCLGAGIL